MILKCRLWLHVVCSFDTKDICHNDFTSMAWRQPKPQPYISMTDCSICYSLSTIPDLPLISFVILRILFDISLISTNVKGCGNIRFPVLFRWDFSTKSWNPIVLSGCCYCRCHCLCRWWALNLCSAWTIPCNVLHRMASVAFLSIPPLRAMMIFLILWITIITRTIAITSHLRLAGLLPSIVLRLPLWEHRCHLQIFLVL